MTTLRPSVRLAAGACLLLATACGDEPVAPRGMEREMEEAAASTISALLTCGVDVAAGTMSCDPAEGPSGPAGGPQMNLIVGSQHHFVRMANDAPVVSEDVWSANVTVQNLTLQPFNTLNGEDAHPAGVRVFFVDEPTNGVVVSNHDGTAPFIDSDPAKYYAYTGADLGGDEILAPGEESEPKGWVFELNGATEFVFSVLISTTVPDPTNVTAGLVRVVTGGFHSCGEDPYGRVYCWGDNRFGQVGDSTAVSQRYVPTRVAAPKGVTLSGVVAGHFHTCAEGSDGKVYCWGQNMVGQLGDGSTTNRLAPVAVSAPANVTLSRLSAGDYHTCANGSDDEIYCWGSNFYGALGDGTKIDSWTPVTVSSPDSVQLVGPEAGGFHTCARSVAGSVYCWGRNGSGQVGDSTAFERILPFEVSAPAGVAFTHLSVGVDHSCAESSDGQVYCWGRNEDDRLGDGSGGDRATPAPVGAPAGVELSSPSAGYAHVCTMGSTALYCWGNNTAGQVGNGNRTHRPLPTIVAGVTSSPVP